MSTETVSIFARSSRAKIQWRSASSASVIDMTCPSHDEDLSVPRSFRRTHVHTHAFVAGQKSATCRSNASRRRIVSVGRRRTRQRCELSRKLSSTVSTRLSKVHHEYVRRRTTRICRQGSDGVFSRTPDTHRSWDRKMPDRVVRCEGVSVVSFRRSYPMTTLERNESGESVRVRSNTRDARRLLGSNRAGVRHIGSCPLSRETASK